MKKYKKPSKSTKKCIEMGGTFIQSRREYTPKRRRSYYSRPEKVRERIDPMVAWQSHGEGTGTQ
jgi:hypothetical protein